MLLSLATVFFLQLSLSFGWDMKIEAPDPTDCTGEKLTFCGVTFHCQCVWTMPTFMGTSKGCGNKPFPNSDEELHPLWLKPNNDETLVISTSEEEEMDNETSDDDEENEDYEIVEQDEAPEYLDTEGCGLFAMIRVKNETYDMLSLRPATLQNVEGSHYLPGNVEAILKIVHQKTGGRCRLKQRSARRKGAHCKMGALKQFPDMNLTEYDEQKEYRIGIRVGLGKIGRHVKRTVVNAVGQAYKDRYDDEVNPCYVAKKKRREIVCVL